MKIRLPDESAASRQILVAWQDPPLTKTPMDCPWKLTGQLQDFCEAELCGWIVEPGNTWSNIGFLLVGMWVWIDCQKKDRPYLKILAITSILTGIGSALYHATGTAWAGDLDLFAMYLGKGMTTSLNLRRLFLLPLWGTLGALILTSTILFWVSTLGVISGRLLFAVGSPDVVLESILFYRDRKIDYTNYVFAWAYLGIALGFWLVDRNRIWCNPNNHYFSGHVLWHLLCSVSYFFFYRFFLQFPTLKKNPPPQKDGGSSSPM